MLEGKEGFWCDCVSSNKKCNFWINPRVLQSPIFSRKEGESPSLPDGKIGIFVAPSKSYRR